MHKIDLKLGKKIYFIGIGGISMSALAKFLSTQSFCVSGSDLVKNEQTDSLAFYGVKTYLGEEENRTELYEATTVVFTDAISEENKEFQRAIQLQKNMLSRAELLQIISDCFTNVIAVAGSHGKTTCSSMCAHILRSCNVPFTAHIGGEDSLLGNFYASGNDYLLTEVCEYKKNLSKIHADVGILLNIDKDHLECYENEEELEAHFYGFCRSSKVAFVCADDKRCEKFHDFATFGIQNTLSDYRATHLRRSGEKYSFDVEEYGKTLCRVQLRSIGYCNVYNAIAAFAAARSLGFHEKEIARGLESFSAVKRRFEKIGRYKGASFICDYAHHPKEIASTLRTARGVAKGEVYVVFQPHTYSRTKLLFDEFVDVLRTIKNLVIYKTYPAREVYDEVGSAATLANAVGGCLYADGIYVLKTWLKKTLKEGDVALFLGAGDIYYTARYLLKTL